MFAWRDAPYDEGFNILYRSQEIDWNLLFVFSSDCFSSKWSAIRFGDRFLYFFTTPFDAFQHH
jgi:hypothetical protein